MQDSTKSLDPRARQAIQKGEQKLEMKIARMKKRLATTTGLLILTLCATLATTASVQAYISNYNWILPFYSGYDPFYGTSVVAYKANSTAQLLVSVYNDWYSGPSINVTAVKVSFDWNLNYSSAECPYNMSYGEYHLFKINFTVPSTDVASNMFQHPYVIYVEFTYDYGQSYWSYYAYQPLAVYSVDQADAMDLYRELNAKLQYTPTFHSYEAQMLLSEANTKANIGYYIHYARAEFDLAKAYFGTALGNFDQAFAIESDYAKAYDANYMASLEAALNVTKLQAEAAKTQADAALAEASASMRQADAAMTQANAAMIEANATQTQADAAVTLANANTTQSYAWILFGVGFIIIAIGVLVYAIRRPKIPKTA